MFISYIRGTGLLRHMLQHQGTWRVLDRRACLKAIAIAWALLTIPGLYAQGSKPTDFQVEAAYLYNFGRFVEWPTKIAPTRGDAFTVCVLGKDPFGPALDVTLAGETIDGKRVVAKRISGPQESGNCQILFLSLAEDGRLNKIIETVDKQAILTVSDMPQFAERGGMIQFVLEGSRVRFEVNLTATQRAGLKLSSELLKVATAVRSKPLPGD
ncbi:MAG TPA: YfiR family protein [Candidatus Polarisedimenticolia bacterium]|nr:YfiR family protein [Candidatus Polarisedimenticolia bacterium]